MVASASRDRSIRLWVPSAVRGTSGEFRAHTACVRSVHFSPDGHQLVTSSDDKSIKLWSVAKRRFVLTLHGHSNWVRCSRFSPDGGLVASCADDKSIKLFDPRSAKCTHTFQEMKGMFLQKIFIILWSCNYVLFFSNLLCVITGHALNVEWHPSGTCIGAALSNHAARIYDVRALKVVQHYASHEGAVNRVAFHPSGNYLLTASQDGTMKVIHNE